MRVKIGENIMTKMKIISFPIDSLRCFIVQCLSLTFINHSQSELNQAEAICNYAKFLLLIKTTIRGPPESVNSPFGCEETLRQHH